MSGKAATFASIAVHGVAIVAFAARGSTPVLRVVWRPAVASATSPPAPASATPAIEPLAVVLLEPTPAATALDAAASRERLAATTSAIRAADHRAETAAIASTAGAQLPDRDGSADIASRVRDGARGPDGALPRGLGMRGPDLRLGTAYLERAGRVGHGGPSAPGRGVDPAPGGRGVIYDRVTTMTVERDGTAHLDDLADVDFHWDVRLPTPDAIKDGLVHLGGELRTWYADPYARARVGRPQDVPAYLKMKPGDCDHWDDACSVELRGRDDEATLGEKLARGQIGHGKAELSDAIMRHFIGDIYASRKLKLLDDTREARAVMGAAHRAEDRARSAELMRRNLEALWRATSDPAVRRAALFTLWDECAEPDGADGADGAAIDRDAAARPPTEGDAADHDAAARVRAEGEAGQRARALVIGWIRGHLPAGSRDAYTAAEIAACQAQRQSRQPFVPYDPP